MLVYAHICSYMLNHRLYIAQLRRGAGSGAHAPARYPAQRRRQAAGLAVLADSGIRCAPPNQEERTFPKDILFSDQPKDSAKSRTAVFPWFSGQDVRFTTPAGAGPGRGSLPLWGPFMNLALISLETEVFRSARRAILEPPGSFFFTYSHS